MSSSRVPENIKNKNFMVNIPHSFVGLKPKSRDFFWVCIGFVFAVFVVLMIFIVRENRFLSEWRDTPVSKKPMAPIMSPEERLRSIATETKLLTGTIEQVTMLKNEKTKFLRVRSFVIDRNRLSEVDAGAPSLELPMTEETFEVAVSEKTNVESGGGMDAIRSGDFVSIATQENIFDAKRLTAVSIERLNRDIDGTSVKEQKTPKQ